MKDIHFIQDILEKTLEQNDTEIWSFFFSLTTLTIPKEICEHLQISMICTNSDKILYTTPIFFFLTETLENVTLVELRLNLVIELFINGIEESMNIYNTHHIDIYVINPFQFHSLRLIEFR